MHKDKVQKLILDILNRAGLEVDEVFFDETDDSFTFVSIKTNNPKLLIGRNGETLSALNYIVSKILEKELKEEERFQFIIDVNNFRKNKIDSIRTTAHMLAERAKYFKSNIDVDPMSAYDRKIMHSYLQSIKNIETESIGDGRDRHIVIKYIEETI